MTASQQVSERAHIDISMLSRLESGKRRLALDGHDWMYVLDGRMRLLLGDQDLVIEAGEAVEFSTSTPHWFGAVDGAVEVIAVFGPHGERTHLHQ